MLEKLMTQSRPSNSDQKGQMHISSAPNQSGVQARPVLDLIHRLCLSLDTDGISYCHWKSNAALDRSAYGQNDLDLLVARRDSHRFIELLYQLGFKKAIGVPEKELPGVMHFYGYDAPSARYVHAHVHFQLVLGHDSVKNYRLPIEEPFLASATYDAPFRIPAPEYELVVFIIRMLLKHASWDTALGSQRRLSTSEQSELAYLLERSDPSHLDVILEDHLPFLDRDLFVAFMHNLQQEGSVLIRLRIGAKLRKGLEKHARRSVAVAGYLRVARRWSDKVRRRVFWRRSGKRFENGGALIALVGGDGAGKTSSIGMLYHWLSENFDTVHIHMGKPPRTWVARFIRAGIKVERSFNRGSQEGSIPFPGYMQLLWHLMVARDRCQAYSRAHRFAANGGLVVCDRFPLPSIKSMDGPQISFNVAPERQNWLIDRLLAAEERYYQHISLPDLLIVLRLNPEVAVQRKPEESADSVRRRNQEIWQLDWQGSPAHVIDASQPIEIVEAQLKSLVWSIL